MPLTVLGHEGAHYLAGQALGFRGLELRAFSVAFDRGDYATSHRILMALAGILVTALITLVAGGLAWRRPGPWSLGLAVAAPQRAVFWLLIGIMVLLGKGVVTGGDEAVLSTLTGLPLWLTAGSSVALLAFALAVAWRAPRELLLPIVAGQGVGWALYLVIAPRLLP